MGVALASEVKVTGQFNTMASAAIEAGDHRGFQFLQWFIDEQVEEERTMGALLDLLASGVNLFQAQELLAGIIGEKRGRAALTAVTAARRTRER